MRYSLCEYERTERRRELVPYAYFVYFRIPVSFYSQYTSLMHTASLGLPPRINRSNRIGIIHSCFHREIVDALVMSATETLLKAGIMQGNISLHPVPGSFEIPLIGAALLEEKAVDALIGLGVVVEGETHHARLIAESAARGMMDLQVQYGRPFAFEVLYVNDVAQAVARRDKGREAATAVLWALAELEKIRG